MPILLPKNNFCFDLDFSLIAMRKMANNKSDIKE